LACRELKPSPPPEAEEVAPNDDAALPLDAREELNESRSAAVSRKGDARA
jgi:hypothetical protein